MIRKSLAAGVAVTAMATSAVSGPVQWDRHRVNEFRVRHGVTKLHHSTALDRQAQEWAERLAHGHKLADDPSGRSCAGKYYGSNVAKGHYMGVHELEHLFEKSPEHRANLLDGTYRLLGVGVVKHHHYTYLVQEFCGGE